MKVGKSLVDLAQEIQRQQAEKRDFIAPSESLRIQTNADSTEHDSTLSINMNGNGSEAFRVTDHTHQQIATTWKIPTKYYDRLRTDHPDLLDWSVNTLMHRENKNRMVRVLDGNARALMSHRYRPLDNFDLANTVLPVLSEQQDMQIVSCDVTQSRMYIKALFPRIESEVKQGDPVQSGLVISNSEIGKGSLRAEPLIYRLECLNGMISAYAMKRHHVGRAADAENAYEIFRDETLEADDKAFWLKVADTVRASIDQAKFETIVERLRESTEKKIAADPVKVVERVQKAFTLNDTERSGVLTHLIQGGDLSAWGLANAITRTSQDVTDYDRATELERIGGNVIELPRRDWETIAVKADKAA